MFCYKKVFDVVVRNIAKRYNWINGKDSKIRISGEFHGNIFCEERVFVDKSAKVFGNIRGMSLDSFGKIFGNIYLENEVNLQAEAEINGDIKCKSINISPDVSFNGKCSIHDGYLEYKNFNYINNSDIKTKQETKISTGNVLNESINVDDNKYMEELNEQLELEDRKSMVEEDSLEINYDNSEGYKDVQDSILNDEIAKDNCDEKKEKETRVRCKLF